METRDFLKKRRDVPVIRFRSVRFNRGSSTAENRARRVGVRSGVGATRHVFRTDTLARKRAISFNRDDDGDGHCKRAVKNIRLNVHVAGRSEDSDDGPTFSGRGGTFTNRAVGFVDRRHQSKSSVRFLRA